MTEREIRTGNPAPELRVIGVGFGRTGTLSLREALVRLGFGPCDHMLENFEHPRRFALWIDAFQLKQRGEPIDWRPLLGGYRAIVDWPGAYFWQELTAAHPQAKVILTVRDPDRWYESVRETIYAVRAQPDNSPWQRALLGALAVAVPALRSGLRVADEIIWDGTFDGRFLDREHAIAVFAAHNQSVREAIASDRLLVFDVKQGWEPLCSFLGVPVPAGEPFPHLNDAGSFQQQAQERFARAALRNMGTVLAIAAGLVAVKWLVRRVRQEAKRR